MSSIGRRVLILIAFWGLIALPAHAQGNRTLVFLQPVQSQLDDQTPAEDWTFDGYADQVISVIVTTISGNLDPMLQIIGPDGAVLFENDDLDSLVTDAGVEVLALPAKGSYTVRVMRYGTTAGRYELTLSPGFARLSHRDQFNRSQSVWVPADNQAVTLWNNKLRVRVVPADTMLVVVPSSGELYTDFYYQVSVDLVNAPSYAEFGMIFRRQIGVDSLQAYQFKVNTEGKWMLLLADASGQYVLQGWTSNRALNISHRTLAVLARGTTFAFYGNGVLLGTVTDDRLESGTVGLLVATRPNQPDPATVLFDDVIVTTRLGTTYRGLPLALTTWDSADPEKIGAELVASGQVTLAPERDLYIPQTSLTASDPAAPTVELGTERARYVDFLLGATVNISTAGQSVGCGVVYRWRDARNLDMAYVDTAGGFGVVQSQDGVLTTNVYDLSRMVRLGPNKLLVIAQGDRLALYVNGALVTQETITPGEGRVGVTLLNYEDVRTDCTVRDLWVWPLAD